MGIERMRIIKALENINHNEHARGFLHELKEAAKNLSIAYVSGDNESMEIIVSAPCYDKVTEADKKNLVSVLTALVFDFSKYLSLECMPHFVMCKVTLPDFTFLIDVQIAA